MVRHLQFPTWSSSALRISPSIEPMTTELHPNGTQNPQGASWALLPDYWLMPLFLDDPLPEAVLPNPPPPRHANPTSTSESTTSSKKPSSPTKLSL